MLDVLFLVLLHSGCILQEGICMNQITTDTGVLKIRF